MIEIFGSAAVAGIIIGEGFASNFKIGICIVSYSNALDALLDYAADLG